MKCNMPGKNMIFCFLVDNNGATSQGIKYLLEGEADIRINNGKSSAAFIDIQLCINDQDGKVIAEEIKNRTNSMKMIFISMKNKGSYIEHAISALKKMQEEDSGAFIGTRVQKGLMRRHASMNRDNDKSNALLQSPVLLLSRREIDVIVQLAQGLSNKEIADKLFISERTVKTHVYNVFRKLEIENRIELTLYAFQSGLIKTSP